MKVLKRMLPKKSGRMRGRVTVRHQGGRHKRILRSIDFKRDKLGLAGRVVAIEYDPNRTADIALIHYPDGEKRYILSPLTLTIGDSIVSDVDAEIKIGNTLPLEKIPVGTVIHNIEMVRGKGGQIARGAGTGATVFAREDTFTQIKMPSGEIRRIHSRNFATIGQVGNITLKDRIIGKAGRSRNMGIRPTVRGVAMNPRSHPHGGGEGRSSVGRKKPMTVYGRPAVGNTRKKKKYSNKFIISRRKR